MGVIFPLSVAGKVVLILIAIVLGIVCMALWSEKFRVWLFRRKAQPTTQSTVSGPAKTAPKDQMEPKR